MEAELHKTNKLTLRGKRKKLICLETPSSKDFYSCQVETICQSNRQNINHM